MLVKFQDFAENMIRLSDRKPYEDIDNMEIGLRPCEKSYEELLMRFGYLDRTDNEMIFMECDKDLSRQNIENKIRILNEAISDENQGGRCYHDSVSRSLKAVVLTLYDSEVLNERACGKGGMLIDE